jgi:hypothetical protein
MSGHVFISHSDKDKTFADMLLGALEARGVTCWIAPRDIPPGGSYADAIMRAIEEAGCFLLVYTSHSNNSPHVLREVERALKFERNIIPIRFDDSQPSRSLDYLLATVQWLSVDTSKASGDVRRVADQISKCVAPRETEKPPIDAPPPRAPDRAYIAAPVTGRGPPKILIGSMLVLALCAALAFVWWVLSNREQHFKIADKTTALSTSATPITLPYSFAPPVVSKSPPQTLESPSPAPSQPATQFVHIQEPTAPPASPLSQPQTSPVETAAQGAVRAYFNAFGERDAQAAYNLFSKGFRQNMSFRKYSDLFSSTREIRLSESKVVNQTENNAVVFVGFEEVNAEYHKVDWQGPIELVREGNDWRIRTLKDLKEVPASTIEPNASEARPNIRTPEKRWPKPHVYLQLADDSQRNAALELKRRLTQLGWEVVGIQNVAGNVDRPTQTSEIRYFSNGDAAEAQNLANQIQPFFGSTGVVTSLPEGMPYVSHSRQYEIWFSTAFH